MFGRRLLPAIILACATAFASAASAEQYANVGKISIPRLNCVDGVSVRIISEDHTANGSSVTYRSDVEETGDVFVASGFTSDFVRNHDESNDQLLVDETVVYARLQEDLGELLAGIEGVELDSPERTVSQEHVFEKTIIRIGAEAYPTLHFGETAGQVYRLGRAMAYDEGAVTNEVLAYELVDALAHCTFLEADP